MNRLTFVANLIALSLPLAMLAQDPAQTPAPPATVSARSAPAGRTPDQLLRFYDSKLTLTGDQKAQLLPLIADRQQKMQDLRADTSSRPRDRMKKAQSLQADSDKKINAVLTPDQRTKYAALEEQQKEAIKERRAEKKAAN